MLQRQLAVFVVDRKATTSCCFFFFFQLMRWSVANRVGHDNNTIHFCRNDADTYTHYLRVTGQSWKLGCCGPHKNVCPQAHCCSQRNWLEDSHWQVRQKECGANSTVIVWWLGRCARSIAGETAELSPAIPQGTVGLIDAAVVAMSFEYRLADPPVA